VDEVDLLPPEFPRFLVPQSTVQIHYEAGERATVRAPWDGLQSGRHPRRLAKSRARHAPRDRWTTPLNSSEPSLAAQRFSGVDSQDRQRRNERGQRRNA
jgi:hypothetical protein